MDTVFLVFIYSLLFSAGGAAQWVLQGPYSLPQAPDLVRQVPVPPVSVCLYLTGFGLILYLFYLLVCLLLFMF